MHQNWVMRISDGEPCPHCGELPLEVVDGVAECPNCGSVSQENARESARSYLSLMAVSRQGLIDQLEFEGYSTADATYGVDAQNAD